MARTIEPSPNSVPHSCKEEGKSLPHDFLFVIPFFNIFLFLHSFFFFIIINFGSRVTVSKPSEYCMLLHLKPLIALAPYYRVAQW